MAVLVKINRRVTLAARPAGFPKDEDFALDEVEVAEAGRGEVLVRVLWVSVDPYQRGRMSEARSYAKSLELGEVITSQSVGEVVESHDGRYSPGDLVVGQLGWQEYAVVRGGALRKVPEFLDPPTLALHVVGMTGMTAYFGLLDVGQPKPGDTVVVSGAAGAVGQVVGQISKLMGCRTVGIAGGPDKCTDCKLYGYDDAIDYKDESLDGRLRALCPGGVDVYFDNVGGDVSAAVHRRLNVGARIVICGQISQYNLERPDPTFFPSLLIVFRARMQGFLVTDYAHRFDEAAVRLARWVAEGKIRWREDITEGLENAPSAFMGMLRGENRGKALVKVAQRAGGARL
ncbi:MAG TPA: NADP-dependent oxidoreductase [Gaiellaceae bacterium]|nr:NADP-dependent oxidoreductase [Gaiellaceae bacterium]